VTFTFAADESIAGEINKSDGTYAIYTDDGEGNTEIANYAADGTTSMRMGTLAILS